MTVSEPDRVSRWGSLPRAHEARAAESTPRNQALQALETPQFLAPPPAFRPVSSGVFGGATSELATLCGNDPRIAAEAHGFVQSAASFVEALQADQGE